VQTFSHRTIQRLIAAALTARGCRSRAEESRPLDGLAVGRAVGRPRTHRAGVAQACGFCPRTSTIWGMLVIFTRGRPVAAPRACSLASSCRQFAYVIMCVWRSASRRSIAAVCGCSGCNKRPASRSASMHATVSIASGLLLPITPLGPRLIQPAAYWRRLEQFAESLTDLTSRGRSQPGLLPRANLQFEVSRPENPPKNVPVWPV